MGAQPGAEQNPITASAKAWSGPVVASVLASLVLASFGFAALVGVAGTEESVSADLGAGLGQAAHRTAEGESATWDRWPIAYTALLQLPLWIGLLGPLLWAGRKQGKTFGDLVRWRFTPRDVLFGMATGIGLQLAVPLLYFLIFQLVGERDVGAPARELASRANGPGILLLILITVIGAPIIEEVFYRGFLQPLLHAWMPSWAAVGAASAVFAAFHFQALQFPALFVFALVVGGWAIRLRGIGRSIWIHIGFNATSVVSILLFV